MNKEAIIRKMFDDLVKFIDSELFLKEIDILNNNLAKFDSLNIDKNKSYENELNNLNNILLDILSHIDITLKNINQVIQIFNMIQKQGYSDFFFTKAIIVINDERIVFGDYIQKTYNKVGATTTLINNAIDESEDLIYIASKKKAPTYINKENKKIYT